MGSIEAIRGGRPTRDTGTRNVGLLMPYRNEGSKRHEWKRIKSQYVV